MLRGSVLGAALCLALAASCAGRSISEDGGGGTGNNRSPRATGGTYGGPTPGEGATGGSTPAVSSGGTSSSVGGSNGVGGASTNGGTAPTAGRPSGTGAQAGKGHDTVSPAGGRPEMTGGEAGALQAGDTGNGEGGHGGEAVICTGELSAASDRLSHGHCREGEAYAQGPTYELVAGATTVDACLAACNARPDCSAVSEYFELNAPNFCLLSTDACDSPAKPIWADEDGGRTFRKTGNGDVHTYEPLGLLHCNAVTQHEQKLSGASSLDECLQACDADESCTGVVDYFYLNDVDGHCFLNLGPCSSVTLTYEDGNLYRRSCD